MSRYGDVLSFGQNSNVKIYSKSAGSDESLWGVEIKNKRGYAPAKMIRESRILYTGDSWYEVSTAEEQATAPPPQNDKVPAAPEVVATSNEPATVAGVESMASDSTENVSGEADLAKKKEEVLVEEPKVEEQIAGAFQQLPEPEQQQQQLFKHEEEGVEDVPVVLEKIPSATSLNIPSSIEELREDKEVATEKVLEDKPPTFARLNTVEEVKETSDQVPEMRIEEPEPQNVEKTENPVVDDSEDDEAEIDYEDDEEEEDDEGEDDEEEEAIKQPAPPSVDAAVEVEPEVEEPPPPQENSQPPVIENIVPPTPIVEQQPVTDLPLIVPVPEEVPSSSANIDKEEKIELPPDVVNNVEVNDFVNPPPAQTISPPSAEVPPQSTGDEADQVVRVPDDLPTPPSSLLGNFINMNSDAVPLATPSPPPAMHFEVTEKPTMEELENSTDSFKGNETDATELAKEEQSQQGADVVAQKPMDPPGLPVVGQYVNENYGEKYFEAIPPPQGQGGQERPIMMENRIPPVVQEQLEINDYYQQLQSNSGKYPEIPQHKYIPAPAAPSYPPPPPQVNDQQEHHSHDPPAVEIPQEQIPLVGHGTVEEQFVPSEIPRPSIPQEVNYHQDLPVLTPESTQSIETPMEVVADEEKPEEVESGPGFMENIIGHAKSLLGSIDLTSLFKSKESPTPPDSIVYGEHVEGTAEEGKY